MPVLIKESFLRWYKSRLGRAIFPASRAFLADFRQLPGTIAGGADRIWPGHEEEGGSGCAGSTGFSTSCLHWDCG